MGTFRWSARAACLAVAIAAAVSLAPPLRAQDATDAPEATAESDVAAGTDLSPDEIKKGRETAELYCSGCHAVGPEGQSPLPEAPAFRTLGWNYPVSYLQEALAEGIVTGHPDMPEFAWEPDVVAAFIAYLQSIQVPKGAD